VFQLRPRDVEQTDQHVDGRHMHAGTRANKATGLLFWPNGAPPDLLLNCRITRKSVRTVYSR
jgi:hypothetical protein